MPLRCFSLRITRYAFRCLLIPHKTEIFVKCSVILKTVVKGFHYPLPLLPIFAWFEETSETKEFQQEFQGIWQCDSGRILGHGPVKTPNTLWNDWPLKLITDTTFDFWKCMNELCHSKLNTFKHSKYLWVISKSMYGNYICLNWHCWVDVW